MSKEIPTDAHFDFVVGGMTRAGAEGLLDAIFLMLEDLDVDGGYHMEYPDAGDE